MPKLFVVSPAFNEAAGVARFVTELQRELSPALTGHALHLVLVDDGSTDGTASAALAAARPLGLTADVLRLSRNFGQQAAIQAGLEHAFALHEAQAPHPDSVLFAILDADLQHPPALLRQMLHELAAGFDHVQMCRQQDGSLPLAKRLTSRAFYALFRLLGGSGLEAGSSDFRLFNLAYCRAYLAHREVNRFNRALFATLGFRTKRLFYQPAQRAEGHTKYSLWKMLRLGLHGLVQFTNSPLIFCALGTFLLSALVCLLYAVVEITKFFQGVQFAVGWPTLIFFVFFWGGLISLNQLVSSLYLASIYNEVKKRPIYLVESVQSIPAVNGAAERPAR